MPKVVYLTGAPAAGKSTTTAMLVQRVPGLLVWEYGARLTDYIIAKTAGVSDQDDLRAKSSSAVTPEDVSEVDKQLLNFVQENRAHHNIIIDSHPVTKEVYGYRITPFSLRQFEMLSPDEIWVLYASPSETRKRISAKSGGRPMVSEEEARNHTMLQSSVAATYAMTTGCAAYLFDTEINRDDLVARLAGRLQ